MRTEIWIERRGLDISADISALLTFALDDIKDFSSRSTTWSKTIVLPGTANNNRLFGQIFQIGQANDYVEGGQNVGYNFNASKSAECFIFQDHIQTFKGVLRLLQINITKGNIEYEVSVFGELSSLNSALSSGYLENLDFSAYNHTFSGGNIISSWDIINGTGYFYPLIDYGTYSTDKKNWDIRTFRPAMFIREYIDKMFTNAGFRWSSDLMETDRFKSLIVPHNRKELTVLDTDLFSANIDYPPAQHFDIITPNTFVKFTFDNTTGTGFSSDAGKGTFTYASAIASNVLIQFRFKGRANNTSQPKMELWKNGSEKVYSSAILTEFFDLSGSTTVPLQAGDFLEWRMSRANVFLFITAAIDMEIQEFTAETQTPVSVPISTGDLIKMNDYIPKNVRQIDFLVSIVKLFNLYVYEDRFDTRLIYLTPYIDFYDHDTSNAVNWTYKMNRDKAIKIKPMAELNAKIYNFKFKPDNDYYNELYRKRYGQGYGDYTYDTQFEFSQQSKEFEIIFSSTPLVGYLGEDKIYPTIFKRTGPDSDPVEETVDSNIRILQAKKITGVELWEISDAIASISFFQSSYGYAGHLDDPDVPSNDLNFGALREVFFELVTGDLSKTQFNVYWSGYMAEITDKDSKMLIASFYLTPKDILQLDFSKYVTIDGVTFRINSIKDYNASRPSDCVVELIKVNHTTYSAAGSGELPPEGCYLIWDVGETIDWDDDEPLFYQECGGAPEPPDPPEPACQALIEWDFTEEGGIGGQGVMNISVNGFTVVNVSANSSGSFSVNEGDEIVATVIGQSGTTRDVAVSGDHTDSDTNASGNAVITFNAACEGEYFITGSVFS